MGRFIIPLQQAPPRRRHLRSSTSPSHLAYRIHTQRRCSTPPATAWLISHQALYFSSEQPISHVAQQSFTSDSVNLWKIARRRCSAKWRKMKLFTFKKIKIRDGCSACQGCPQKEGSLDKAAQTQCSIYYLLFLDEDVSSYHLELHCTSQYAAK